VVDDQYLRIRAFEGARIKVRDLRLDLEKISRFWVDTTWKGFSDFGQTPSGRIDTQSLWEDLVENPEQKKKILHLFSWALVRRRFCCRSLL
jgi:hypothetical protein